MAFHEGSTKPPSRRRRTLRFLVSLGVFAALATTAVVVALNRLGGGEAVAERCTTQVGSLAWSATPQQADNAALIVGVALRRELPAPAATIGLATAIQESKLLNISHGDRDSVGLFQQRPSQGWGTVEQIMDPIHATNAFYDALESVAGYQDLPITEAAQAVQRSGFPDAYAQHEDKARAWSSALNGYSPASLTCALAPATDAEAAGGTAQVTVRIARDLGDLPTTIDGTSIDVDAQSLASADPTRAAWALGQWAVAVADATGVDAVQVSDQRWSRKDPSWRAVDNGTLPVGHVRIEVAQVPTG